ncbi:ABC transporter ATP-binding protein [Lentilitoribacter sp. EG35]|uniref:ABC transporter ATP-binding protein n=1 Tax=Lentilitoribacter sp. EG35 TaxID=3234192 RepID=UPI003460A489
MITAPNISVKGTALIGDRVLFENLHVDIQSGKTTCLLGASGVGKSTILRLIANLDTGADFSGEVRASDGKSLKNRIGYMAQGSELFPWLSVLDNVLLGARLRGEGADKMAALSIIEKVGLSDHLTKKPSQMSGGERQRIALARTLMEDRPIILLDEPFSALDAKTRSEMQELAGNLLAGRTVLLVTHDPAEAARLGHAIYMLTEQGITNVDVPATHPVREIDDEATLHCQGQLYRLLRGTPS